MGNKKRTALKKIGSDERHRYTGTFKRYGFKCSYKGSRDFANPTLLLLDLKDETGKVVTDHLWLNCGKTFKKLGCLLDGDTIAFNGRVESYVKGYKGFNPVRQVESPISTDYKLSRPTKVSLESQTTGERGDLPEANFEFVTWISRQNDMLDRLPASWSTYKPKNL